MNSVEDIAGFLARQPHIRNVLIAVDALGIEDCWVGAGLIRNAVWDHLHGFSPVPAAGSDVDVVYFDAGEASIARDLAIEAHLFSKFAAVPWSVRNQARMHIPNEDLPYCNVADAMRHWPETATAIAARMRDGTVEVLAPHGIEDLVGLIVRPTPTFARKMPAYERRRAAKNWAQRWPRLKFIGA